MYDILNQNLQEDIQMDRVDIEEFQFQYQKLNELTKAADDSLHFYLGGLVAFHLLIATIQSYLALTLSLGTFLSRMNHYYWVFDRFISMLIVCYASSSVNTKVGLYHMALFAFRYFMFIVKCNNDCLEKNLLQACALQETLYKIPLAKMNLSRQMQANAFIIS